MPREEVEGIILYFVAQSKTTTFNETQKILFIESLECLGYGLRDRPEYQKNISAIMTTILMMFHDDNENIKLAAIGSVYSIFNCLADDCLSIFTLTFN